MMKASTVVVLLASLSFVSAFYLPGVTAVNYQNDAEIALKVNKLTSVETQIPYDYYSVPFCKPKEIKAQHETLGEIFRGDDIENSPYHIQGRVDTCKILRDCAQGSEYAKKDLEIFAKRIKQKYRVHWIIDNLSAAQAKTLQRGNETKKIYEIGFPLGFVGSKEIRGSRPGEPYIFNHIFITMLYHRQVDEEDTFRIVGFEVVPFSRKHDLTTYNASDPSSVPRTCTVQAEYQSVSPTQKGPTTILFSYQVMWRESTRLWAERWDPYFVSTDPQIHWFAIINSVMIVLFLTGMVAMILMRTLHADIKKYNLEEPDEAEETGWKLVHGDVFRPPKHRMLLAVLIGSGVQVFTMVVVTLVFAVLGFLSPANRGGLGTAMVVFFVVCGLFAGYYSTRAYKVFHGTEWKKNTVFTAMFLPGLIFGIFFFVNFFMWGEGSSAAIPFGTMVALVALWFCISLPLIFCGSYFAFKQPVADPPVSTNTIPRQIPSQVWYMNPTLSVLMGGVLPFGAVFIELFFILSAIWGDRVYYLFGFLFLVFAILLLTSSEITIVMCYFQLCSEDYHWWWRSYLTSASSGLHMFFYSIFYFYTKLDIYGFIPTLVYFCYSLVMSIAFSVLTGVIGYYSCSMFVRKIYHSIHVD